MENLELEVAIKELNAHVTPLKMTKTVPLIKALHHHLAVDIYAPINVPSFNRSAMDGYAVKASQTKSATKATPVKMKAIRVMTGASIPDGFDAVIRQEDTNYGNDEVEIYTEVKPYTNYIKIGEDIEEGQLMITRTTRLIPVHLGILASLGISEVKVFQPLKVGIISSGSELAQINQKLKQGQIYNSNAFVLAARLRELNVDVVFMKQAIDDAGQVSGLIRQLIAEIDMLMTTGGVSVGITDIMHDVIKELAAKRLFWRVNMRPGTPVLASIYQHKPILSLSGNPFAALTTFELLFRPMLSAFMQTEDYLCKRRKAILMDDFTKASPRRRFVRAYYEAGQVFLTTSAHASSVLSSMTRCNCLIDIKAQTPKLEKGSEVQVVVLD